MSTSSDPLARRYRRLLACYPPAYRRSRGDEIVATMLDAAPAGRTRPTLRESFDLIRFGLRCRLGRPASRTVVVWALATAAICGLFSAALATRIAWETSPAQPDRGEAADIFHTILPDHKIVDIYTPPALFTVYGQPLRPSNVSTLLFGDGGEYAESSVGLSLNGTPPVDQERTLDVAQQRLRENGWRLYPTRVSNAAECNDDAPACDPSTLPTDTHLGARRGDTIFELDLMSQFSGDTTYLSASLYRAAPFAVYPAGIVGGLIGAALAWLVFGWASRRGDGRPAITAAATVPYCLAMFFWWAPVVYVVPTLIRYESRTPDAQWPPLWEWLGQPTLSLAFLVGCAGLALALGIVLLPRRAANGSQPTLAA